MIIKTVTNTEYIKTTEFVEVEKSAGPESVSGVNLPEGPGKQGPTEYCKLKWVLNYFRYLSKEGEVSICFAMYGDFMTLTSMVYVLGFNDIAVSVCDYSISVFHLVVIQCIKSDFHNYDVYGILLFTVVQGKQAVKADGTPVSTFMVYIYPYYFRNCIT